MKLTLTLIVPRSRCDADCGGGGWLPRGWLGTDGAAASGAAVEGFPSVPGSGNGLSPGVTLGRSGASELGLTAFSSGCSGGVGLSLELEESEDDDPGTSSTGGSGAVLIGGWAGSCCGVRLAEGASGSGCCVCARTPSPARPSTTITAPK